MRIILIFSVFFYVGNLFSVQAEVTLPRIFSDHMVLQRNTEAAVWGTADRNERITVSFRGETAKTKTGRDGKWMVRIPTGEAGGPFELEVTGENTVTFTDVLVGEVWICSGQSNMYWRVDNSNNAEEEIAQAQYPEIRLFQTPNVLSVTPMDDVPSGHWQVCSPQSVPGFSAVAYYFGRKLHQELGIPIGLLHTSWGGTVVETWISKESINTIPDFSGKMELLEEADLESLAEKQLKVMEKVREKYVTDETGYDGDRAVWADPDLNTSNWHSMKLPSLWEVQGLTNLDGTVWFRKEISIPEELAGTSGTLHLGKIDDSDKTWINGVEVGMTHNKYDQLRTYEVDPGILKSGKNVIVVRAEDYRGGGGLYGPSTEMYLRVNNQKISLTGNWLFKVSATDLKMNTDTAIRPNDYPTLLYNAMIHPFVPFGMQGAIWYQGESNASRAYQYRRLFPLLIHDWRSKWERDFPFLWVQLANYRAPAQIPGSSAWAELREAQTMTLSVPNTAMATAIDIGEADDIHPRNKQEVGRRLALHALRLTYDHDIIASGPEFQSMEVLDGGKVRVNFKNVGTSLEVQDRYGYVKGFTLAGSDKVFYWARGYMEDRNSIIIYSDQVPNPVAVRYGWADNPDDVNIYNSAGLPAVPFRSDTWPGITYDQ